MSYCAQCVDRDGDVAELAHEAELLRAEVARLRTELGECIQFAAEGWAYASPYFSEKWGYAKRMAEFASAIETKRTTSAQREKP